jgi:Protein of unknown function (DUF2971)
MDQDHDKILQVIESAARNITRPIDALEPSERIFLHYSSLEAFYSIMDTGRIRFTSVKSTNDPSEFLFGRLIVDRALGEVEDLLAHQRKVVSLCKERISERDFKAFVFCMSEAVDDEADVGELSQWRLYGSNGRGIALVIDVNSEIRRNQIIKLGSRPRKVVYGQSDGLDLVRAEVLSFFNRCEELSNEAKGFLTDNPELCADYLASVLFWLPSVIKHKAYRHEREVRLVRGDIGEQSGNPLVFNERNFIRRPAIELPFSETLSTQHSSPITRVIIGPSGDQSAIEDSIKFYLQARNWKLEVVRSDIPYRA